MSIKEAHLFIQRVGEDPALQERLRALRVEGDLQSIVELAAELELEFDVEELHRAHRDDWKLRHVFYSSRSPKPGRT